MFARGSEQTGFLPLTNVARFRAFDAAIAEDKISLVTEKTGDKRTFMTSPKLGGHASGSPAFIFMHHRVEEGACSMPRIINRFHSDTGSLEALDSTQIYCGTSIFFHAAQRSAIVISRNADRRIHADDDARRSATPFLAAAASRDAL